MVKIEQIDHNSAASRAGLRAGDILLTADGHVLRDALDVQFYIDTADSVRVVYRRGSGENTVVLDNSSDEFSGIEPEPLVIRRCRNKCIFCFIDQQPKGLRDTLYVKDEDIRYSFLDGNYITATNIPDWEWNRIIEQRMSPLYFSVHATDETVRSKLLGVSDAPPIMPILEKLVARGIGVHSQIVLVPGYNDGPILERTLHDLYKLGANSLSCAVVPVGLTRFRDGLPLIEPVSNKLAINVIDIIGEMRSKSARPAFFQAADEMFLLSDRPIPPDDYYGDYPQLDNGVGMVRLFIDDAMECLSSPELILEGKRKLKIDIITGARGSEILSGIMPENLGIQGVTSKVIGVPNRFWGESVTAANLLTGRDIYNAIKDSNADIVFIPPNVLNSNGLFLDDMDVIEMDREIHGEIACNVRYLSEMQELILSYSRKE